MTKTNKELLDTIFAKLEAKKNNPFPNKKPKKPIDPIDLEEQTSKLNLEDVLEHLVNKRIIEKEKQRQEDEKAKKPKVKRVISEERKAILREQMQRGRENSLKKRREIAVKRKKLTSAIKETIKEEVEGVLTEDKEKEEKLIKEKAFELIREKQKKDEKYIKDKAYELIKGKPSLFLNLDKKPTGLQPSEPKIKEATPQTPEVIQQPTPIYHAKLNKRVIY